MIVLLPLLLSVVGAVLYLAMANPKAVELARLVFGASFLVLVYVFAQASVRVLIDK